jgi:hypothetical protein
VAAPPMPLHRIKTIAETTPIGAATAFAIKSKCGLCVARKASENP